MVTIFVRDRSGLAPLAGWQHISYSNLTRRTKHKHKHHLHWLYVCQSDSCFWMLIHTDLLSSYVYYVFILLFISSFIYLSFLCLTNYLSFHFIPQPDQDDWHTHIIHMYPLYIILIFISRHSLYHTHQLFRYVYVVYTCLIILIFHFFFSHFFSYFSV